VKFRFSREVNCPQKIAFDYYADRDKDLEWWRGVLETRVTSRIRGGVGEVNHQRVRVPGLPITYEQDVEVVEWDSPHRWREICRNAPLEYDTWYVVEKIDEQRSRVVLEGETELAGIWRLFEPLVRWLLTREAERNFDVLKARLDRIGADHRAGVAART
jgi:hypothetical protein